MLGTTQPGRRRWARATTALALAIVSLAVLTIIIGDGTEHMDMEDSLTGATVSHGVAVELVQKISPKKKQQKHQHAKVPLTRKTRNNLISALAFAIAAQDKVLDYVSKHRTRLYSIGDFLVAFGRSRTVDVANEYLHLMGDLNAKWTAGIGNFMLKQMNANILRNGIIKAGRMAKPGGSHRMFAMLDPRAVGLSGSLLAFSKMAVPLRKFGAVRDAITSKLNKSAPIVGAVLKKKKKLTPAERAKQMRRLVVAALKKAVKANTINAGKHEYLKAVNGGHVFSAPAESALAERQMLQRYGLMSASNLEDASRSVAFKAAVAGARRAFQSAEQRKADKVTKVDVQVKAAISETNRVLDPPASSLRHHNVKSKMQLYREFYARYRKRGLTRKQAVAKAKVKTIADLQKQERAYFRDRILGFAAKSNVKPVAPVSNRFQRRAVVVEEAEAANKAGQQAAVRGKKLGLTGAKLLSYVQAAVKKAKQLILKKMRSNKARRVATEQAARLGVDAKIASIDVPTAAEKVKPPKKKAKPLTVAQQLKHVVNMASTLRSQSALLVKQNTALQAEVSKLSKKVAQVPALQNQLATLQKQVAVKKAP